MVWRVLGAVLVLLAVGVAGGYAVADRTAPAAVETGTPTPVPALDPAAPTPPAVDLVPDPDDAPLDGDVPTEERTLRTKRTNGDALSVDVPVGWTDNRQKGSATWNFVSGRTSYLYVLRIGIVAGAHQSVAIQMSSRMAALRESAQKGFLSDLEVTPLSDDSYSATYVSDGHLRVTREQWFSVDGGSAYAVAAVTGRTVDEPGIETLLARTIASMREVEE
jgi:hypothetical protein